MIRTGRRFLTAMRPCGMALINPTCGTLLKCKWSLTTSAGLASRFSRSCWSRKAPKSAPSPALLHAVAVAKRAAAKEVKKEELAAKKFLHKKVKVDKSTDKIEKVFVSYVGGTADEDEWIAYSSKRLRPPTIGFTDTTSGR